MTFAPPTRVTKVKLDVPEAEADLHRGVETLVAISRAINSRLELTEVLRQATREMVRALDADIGTVWRLEASGDELVPVAGYHVPKSLYRAASGSLRLSHHSLVAAVKESGGPVFSSDSANDLRFNYSLLALVPHKSVLIQPLRVKGQIAGIFAFIWTRARHPFSGVELRLIDAVTEQASVAMENAQLLHEVRQLNQHLEQRVIDRTSQLQRAYEQLRASRNELRALSTHMERVRERERTRIAREIHDELGQSLTCLRMELSRAEEHGHHTPGAADLAASHGIIDGMMTTVRRIASELRPQVLDDLGLLAALEWQAHTFEKHTGIKCRFRAKGTPSNVDIERTTALFRIFQEILTNVARHAGATRVSVTFSVGRTSLSLKVGDNGKGMGLVRSANKKRLGLLGMQERAAAVGGRVVICSAPGAGTTVRARIPLPRSPLPSPS